MVAPDELWPLACTRRVILDKVHRLLVTLSYFQTDRFVQLLSLIPILILLLYLIVLINLVYTGICGLGLWSLSKGEQLYSNIYSNGSVAETTSSFSTYK